MRRAHWFVALLGLVACAGTPAEKPETAKSVAPQRVEPNEASSATAESVSHWSAMLRDAYTDRDAPSAVLSLTVIAERWPDTLTTLPRPSVSYAIRKAEGDERYRLCKALLASSPGREIVNGGYLWREFALLQLGRGEQKAAAASLAAITHPHVIISVMADKRFDPIRANVSPPLDVQRGAALTIDADREACRKHPDQLLPVIELVDDLLTATRFADALQEADDARAKADGPRGPSEYTDYQDQYVWLLDYRARALRELGRWTEAVQQLDAASRLSGNGNVSQVLNLALLYNRLGQPEAARQTLLRVAPRLSAYGSMQNALEVLRSALQLGDREASQRALDFLREHQADSVKTYERALLEVGKPQEAAQLLIKQLQDTKQRSETLLRVQDYAHGATTERMEEYRLRWQAMQSLPEVRDAIAAVGHVGSYPVTAP